MQQVVTLEQRRRDVRAALVVATQTLEQAQEQQRQHEYHHWLTISQRPELGAVERWCAQLLAGVPHPSLPEEVRKYVKPETRVAIVADLKQRFPCPTVA